MGVFRIALAALFWGAAVESMTGAYGKVLGDAYKPHTKQEARESTRIFGGGNASRHQFPSQVYILSYLQSAHDDYPSGMFCGGTILSEKWVLTAAHCVKDSIETEVGYGSHNRNKLFKIMAARTIWHEGYKLYGRKDNNAVNDIGLIELKKPIPLDGHTAAAATLPNSTTHGDTHPPYQSIVVVGWGRWSYDFRVGAGSTVELQYLHVKIIPCPGNISGVICVLSDVGTGICDGDSGGPLLINGVLNGVASYVDHTDQNPDIDPNLFCNALGSYAVYMSVIAHRDWIRSHSGI